MQNLALIVNRDVGSSLLLGKLVAALGYECDIVHNMHDTLRASAAKTYDLVLIACFLSDKVCWVTCQAIKLLHSERRCPTLIGIISRPDPEMQQRCESFGMAGVLAQPVNKVALSECLRRISSSVDFQDHDAKSICSVRITDDCCVQSSSQQIMVCGKQISAPKLAPLLLGGLNLQEAGPLYLGELNSACGN